MWRINVIFRMFFCSGVAIVTVVLFFFSGRPYMILLIDSVWSIPTCEMTQWDFGQLMSVDSYEDLTRVSLLLPCTHFWCFVYLTKIRTWRFVLASSFNRVQEDILGHTLKQQGISTGLVEVVTVVSFKSFCPFDLNRTHPEHHHKLWYPEYLVYIQVETDLAHSPITCHIWWFSGHIIAFFWFLSITRSI